MLGHVGQVAEQLRLPLRTAPPAAHHQPSEHRDQHDEHRREDQRPRQRAGVHARIFPSRAVTFPRSRVAVTVAGRLIDSNGVLADRLARSRR